MLGWDNKFAPADLQAMEQKLIAIQTLANSEGWKIFDTQMALDEEMAYRQILSAKDGIEMAKFVGIHKAIKDLRAFPQRQIEQFASTLKTARST